MWQIHYLRAMEIARDRASEASRERLAREAHSLPVDTGGSRLDGFRRSGAIVAAGIARRLDECVAREELIGRTSDERAILPG